MHDIASNSRTPDGADRMTIETTSRRRFIAMALVAAATPLAAALASSTAMAQTTKKPATKPVTQKPAAPVKAAAAAPAAAPTPATANLPKLSTANPQAAALSYTEDASKVVNPAHQPGSHCANCTLYKGVAGQAYGPCTLFPQNSVAAKGWCAGWVKKPA